MSVFRLCFLGPAQFSRAGQPVELNNAKAVALLAYLAVTGVSQTRDHLTDLLWPDSLPEAARKNLRNTLWTIRKVLGDEVLSGEAEWLRLSETGWSDVRALEITAESLTAMTAPTVDQLRTAIELYRGPLLDGLALSEAPDFELWLATERERFGQLYLHLLAVLIATYRVTTNWTEVIALARRALAYDNLQEPMYRALMEAHARLGERPEALRLYDTLRATLARELGVEPLPETEALRAAILDGNLQPVETPASGVSLRPWRRVEAARRPDLPFVGRQRERAVLNEELQLATSGQARIVLISGELGIGKSRLWHEWSAGLPTELTILATRCLDTTQTLPFVPVIGLFRKQVCLEHLFKPPSPVSPIWLAELARLLPEIREYWPKLPAPASLPPEEERRRLFEAFTQILRALGARPLILFIDDLHWADRTSLDWLVYMVDRMREEPLLLVGAYRPGDASPELSHHLAGWSREGRLRQLPLAQLTLAEATELIAALGGDTTLAGQLQARSAGNPYFLIELSRSDSDGASARLTELVRERLKRLPEAGRQVLQAAAVLQARIEFATLRRTSGRDEEETLDALDTLLEAGVLVEREGSYEFAHPLVATIVRNDLSLARRSFLHRRAAEALAAAHAGHLEPVVGQLAGHYEQAGHPAQAAHYAELAAEHALKLVAYAEAAAFYQKALTLEPTPARRMGLGRALYMQGDLEGARQALSQALAEFETQGDQVNMARASLALAESFLASGQGDMMILWADRARRFKVVHDPEIHACLHFLLGAGSLQSGRPLAEAEAHLLEAVHLATENDLPDMAASSQFELGNLLAERGELAQAMAAYMQAIGLAQAAGNRSQEVLGHNNLAYHAMLAGDLVTARQHIETALALAEANSLFVPYQYLYSTRGEIALAEGQLDVAETWFSRALAATEKSGNAVHAANVRADQGLVARERGQLDQAVSLLEAARQAVADLTAPHLQIRIELWLAELYLQRGQPGAAEEILRQAEARLAQSDRKGLQAWAGRVRAALQS